MFNRALQFVKRNAAPIALTGLVISGSASAAAMDVSTVTTVLTDALVAVAAIGAGFMGFKYLKKVWNRL